MLKKNDIYLEKTNSAYGLACGILQFDLLGGLRVGYCSEEGEGRGGRMRRRERGAGQISALSSNPEGSSACFPPQEGGDWLSSENLRLP